MRGSLIASALAGALFLSGCVATPPSVTASPQPLSTPDKFEIGQESWSVGCEPDQYDPYGKLVEKSQCWVLVSYFGSRNEGRTMTGEFIFKVDAAKGPYLVLPPALDTNICDEVPKRKAVDGKRIDGLPMSKQIEAVLNGSLYVREDDRPWPDCNVYNEVTTIAGARRAYERMMAKWNAKDLTS
jgi:hypothetical protein